MTQISRKPLNPQVEQRIYFVLFNTLAKTIKPEEVQVLLEDLITPVERVILAKRLAIAILLLKGWSYDSIKQTLRVTPTTVSKVNWWLRYRGNGFKKAFDRLMKENGVAEIIDDFKEALLQTEKPAAYKSARWQNRSERGREIYQSRKSRSVI